VAGLSLAFARIDFYANSTSLRQESRLLQPCDTQFPGILTSMLMELLLLTLKDGEENPYSYRSFKGGF